MNAPAGQRALRRAITPGLLLLFMVGDILGGGIYALVGEVAAETGGAVWSAFVLALLMAAFTAGSYAELVAKYPYAGGAGLYILRAFRSPPLAFLVTFAVAMSGVTSASALAYGFASNYLSAFVEVEVVVAAIVVVLALSVLNFVGISESVRANIGFTLVEIAGLALIVTIGVVAVVSGDAEPSRAVEWKGEGGAALAAILSGAALAFYALIGFEDSVNVAEETENPTRVYPRILFLALLITGGIYLLVTVAASAVLPTSTLVEGGLLAVVEQGPLGIPSKVFSAIGLMALANGALINMIMASRLLYGMSREGVVPAPFSIVHAGRRTPWVAIAFVALVAIALVATADLSRLAETTVCLLVVVFATVNVAVLVLRREPAEPGRFRVPTVVPPIGVVVSIALLTQMSADVIVRALLLVALGVVLWAVAKLIAWVRPSG